MALAIKRPAKLFLSESSVLGTLSTAFLWLLYSLKSSVQERFMAYDARFDEMQACIEDQRRQIEELKRLGDVAAKKSALETNVMQASAALAPVHSVGPAKVKGDEYRSCNAQQRSRRIHDGLQTRYGWDEIYQLLQEQQTEVSVNVQQQLTSFQAGLQKRLLEWEAVLRTKSRGARGQGVEVATSMTDGGPHAGGLGPGTSTSPAPVDRRAEQEDCLGALPGGQVYQDAQAYGWGDIRHVLEEHQSEALLKVEHSLVKFQALLEKKVLGVVHERLQKWHSELDGKLLQHAPGRSRTREDTEPEGGNAEGLGNTRNQSLTEFLETGKESRQNHQQTPRESERTHKWENINRVLEEHGRTTWGKVGNAIKKIEATLHKRVQELQEKVERAERKINLEARKVSEVLGTHVGRPMAVVSFDQRNDHAPSENARVLQRETEGQQQAQRAALQTVQHQVDVAMIQRRNSACPGSGQPYQAEENLPRRVVPGLNKNAKDAIPKSCPVVFPCRASQLLCHGQEPTRQPISSTSFDKSPADRPCRHYCPCHSGTAISLLRSPPLLSRVC